MLIEITGPTGAGKTTCSAQLVAALRSDGRNVIFVHGETDGGNNADKLPDFVVDTTKHSVKTDLFLLPFFCFFFGKSFGFTLYVIKLILQAPQHRMALFRSFLRKAGLSVYFSRKKFSNRIVVVDEGLFHLTHNVLVHVDDKPDMARVDKFIRLVPLPDQLLLVMADVVVLLDNLKQRGNWSSRVGNEAELARFVENAHQVYSHIARSDLLSQILIPCETKGLDVSALAKTIATD